MHRRVLFPATWRHAICRTRQSWLDLDGPHDVAIDFVLVRLENNTNDTTVAMEFALMCCLVRLMTPTKRRFLG
jgi:hypothetical protein